MDLFSNLLGGNTSGNASALGALLPLLLGGKNGIDLGGLAKSLGANDALGALAPLIGGSGNAPTYPPLFGKSESPLNLLSSMLGASDNMGKSSAEKTEKNPEYPYELQYNRRVACLRIRCSYSVRPTLK